MKNLRIHLMNMLTAASAVLVATVVAPVGASAQTTCGMAGTSCTSVLTAKINVQSVVWLQFYQDTTNAGCSIDGQAASGDHARTDGTIDFGNANALGIGAPSNTCVKVTQVAGATPQAISHTIYRTSYQLFSQFSGFPTNAASITAYRGAFANNTSTGALDLLEGPYSTGNDDSLGALNTSGSPTTILAGIKDDGAGDTSTRKLAFKLNHQNGTGTTGTESVLITYTLTAD
jgi:hypothetical protein